MTKKFSSTVAGAAVIITLVGLISRGLGIVRESVFAHNFGLSEDFDLYLVGAVLPVTINTILIYIAQNYFIPAYNRESKNRRESLSKFISGTLFFFSAGAIALTLVLYLFSQQIISFYLTNNSGNNFETALAFFRLFLFTIPASSAIAILSAYLQAKYEFTWPAVSQLFLNILTIVVVVFYSSRLGVYSIVYGFLAGIIAQLIFLLIKSKVRLNLKFNNLKQFPRNIYSSLGLIIFIESISQLYLLADRYFSGYIITGGIAALNYASNVYLLPISIISVALSTALFPKLSNLSADLSFTEIELIIKKFVRINLLLFVPITFALWFWGDLFISILFQRGNFSKEDTEITFSALRLLAVSLVFYSSYSVFNKLLYALNMLKQLLIITLIGMGLKIILNFLFVKIMGYEGLALSTTVSYIFFFVSSFAVVASKIKMRNKIYFASKLFFVAAISSASFLITEILSGYLKYELLKLLAFLFLYTITVYVLNPMPLSSIINKVKKS